MLSILLFITSLATAQTNQPDSSLQEGVGKSEAMVDAARQLKRDDVSSCAGQADCYQFLRNKLGRAKDRVEYDAVMRAFRVETVKEFSCAQIAKRPAAREKSYALEMNGSIVAGPMRLWIADTKDLDNIGLMCHKELSQDRGMLFPEASGGVWMFNTYISLAVLFIDKSGVLVDSVVLPPCFRPANATDLQWYMKCFDELYKPKVEYKTMLEITPELFKKLGLKTGDRLLLDPLQ